MWSKFETDDWCWVWVPWSLSPFYFCSCCLLVDSPSYINAQVVHPSLAKSQHLVLCLSKLSTLSYELCHLGKHSRGPFTNHVPNIALSSFALVHFDIWWPNHIRYTLGFQHFVIIIDNYSGCTCFVMNLVFLFVLLYGDNGYEYFSHSF